ncbi:hypothetical protein D9M68_708330 [compost metagenome]
MHQRFKVWDQGFEAGRGCLGHHAAVGAEFGPVHAGGRQLQGLQEVVQLDDRPAGDDGERAVQPLVQRAQRADQFRFYLHQFGPRREVGQRAVEVEKQGGIGFDKR